MLFCAVGLRGYLALRILVGRGYKNVRNLSGGYQLYCAATQEIRNESPQIGKCEEQPESLKDQIQVLKVDACGLQCPGPILKLKETMDGLPVGRQIEVIATDPGFPRDARAWCQSTGNALVSSSDEKGYHKVVIEKGASQDSVASVPGGNNKSFILFSDDLDRAIATFVLANGAAATGKKVSIFFTFWGLNVIKKEHKPEVKKDFFGRMFSWMLPSSSKKLRLSQMSMMGMGGKVMRHLMRKKNIGSLEELRQQAMDQGVEFIACQMTVDMMGIHKEELLDGVTIGGVATYMERAEQSNVNLFI
jgi:peroxiredoxin family protein/TusA-related sulfurtransferase